MSDEESSPFKRVVSEHERILAKDAAYSAKRQQCVGILVNIYNKDDVRDAAAEFNREAAGLFMQIVPQQPSQGDGASYKGWCAEYYLRQAPGNFGGIIRREYPHLKIALQADLTVSPSVKKDDGTSYSIDLLGSYPEVWRSVFADYLRDCLAVTRRP